MEKNEVGCVVVCLQDTTLEFVRFSRPKKASKFFAIKSDLNLETFLDSGLKRRVCLPDKNPEREKERAERGMECEVND